MDPKFCGLALLALCGLLIGPSKAEECVPQSIANMTLDINQHLSWWLRDDEQCKVTSFLVHIFHANQTNEYSFSVDGQHVDVSFLKACEEWVFVVIPVADYVRGAEFRLVSTIPVPASADLSLAYIQVTANGDTGETRLRWDLNDDRFGNCSLRYRVTVENDGNAIIESVFVDRNFFIPNFLVPCTSYQFSVRAINMATPIIEGPLSNTNYDFPALRQGSPTLASVDASATVLNLAFRIENFIRNPCPIRELSIEGGSFFNQSVALHDSGVRPLVNVTIGSLRPNSMYILRASVQNSGGWSQALIAAIQTPDLGPGEA